MGRTSRLLLPSTRTTSLVPRSPSPPEILSFPIPVHRRSVRSVQQRGPLTRRRGCKLCAGWRLARGDDRRWSCGALVRDPLWGGGLHQKFERWCGRCYGPIEAADARHGGWPVCPCRGSSRHRQQHPPLSQPSSSRPGTTRHGSTMPLIARGGARLLAAGCRCP